MVGTRWIRRQIPSRRKNSAGTSPGQIRQEQQPNPAEPPRWFTARRKLVKFKSAFKTGLARCPAPPLSCSRYCRQEIPPGSDRSLSLQHSWEASDGFPSSTHFFQQRLDPSLLSSFHPLAYFPSSSPRRFREQARHQIVTMIIGQDIRRDDVERADDNDDDVVDESDGFRVRIEAFFGCPGGDLADRQQIEVIFRARKRPSRF